MMKKIIPVLLLLVSTSIFAEWTSMGGNEVNNDFLINNHEGHPYALYLTQQDW